jgi:hypothetical protein
MATVRERLKTNGQRSFHAQVRQLGLPARTASFPTKRQAERCKTIEADLIEGRHFCGAAKTDARANWWKAAIGELRIANLTPAVLVEQRGKLLAEKFTRSKPRARHSSRSASCPGLAGRVSC